LKIADRHATCPLYHGPVPPVVAEANVIIITTADGAIEEVAVNLAASGYLRVGTVVFHCSGAMASRILSSAKSVGAVTGTIHPLQTIPSVEVGLATLPRSYFFLGGDEGAVSAGRDLVKKIGGIQVELPGGSRGLYHASASAASNYLVTLLWSAARMMAGTGIGEDLAIRALFPMIRNVIDSVEVLGTRDALTGPVARGDVHTLEVQLEAIARDCPRELSLYVALAYQTIELVREIGEVDEECIGKMVELLKRYGDRTSS
jgi:predicted short-subunit dehydrogenase-like oxidoreductase (DUF2520 family)